jgi:drug/metabolite transporter (DMT)-like permease
MKHERTLAYVAFLIVCVVWGTTYLAIRVALETIPPLLMTGLRYSVAGLILFIAARFRREPLPHDPRTLANLAVIGILMVAIGNLAVVIAEQWVPSGMAALFVATAPFWATLIAALSGSGERIGPASAIGMLAGFAGVGLLVTPGGAGGHYDTKFILGAVIVQFGSCGWQYGTHRAKYTIRNVPFVTSTALQMLFGGIVVDVIGLAVGEGSRFHVNTRTLGALVYLALRGEAPGDDEDVALRLRQSGGRRLPRLADPARAADVGLDPGDGDHPRRYGGGAVVTDASQFARDG